MYWQRRLPFRQKKMFSLVKNDKLSEHNIQAANFVIVKYQELICCRMSENKVVQDMAIKLSGADCH